MTTTSITLHHNLIPSSFVWLWAKYVRGIRDTHHCTNALIGPYSRRLSRHNPDLASTSILVLDEVPLDRFVAIYICGVAAQGYRTKANYPHNLHAAIQPLRGAQDRFVFEQWVLEVRNGIFSPIPSLEQLPDRYRGLPNEFVTCRIFRWAVGHGQALVEGTFGSNDSTRS